MTRGVFVTGTDTGVGKTVVAAALVRAWGGSYWKPAQTGLADGDDDTATVTRLARLPPGRVAPPACALQAPLSPAAAAALEGTTVDFARLAALPALPEPLVVEGAGGVLVPLDGERLMVDLMARLGLPVLLVARSTLGTINHSLLSLEALRARGLAVAGIVMSGPRNPGNRAALEQHGRVRVLAELPHMAPLDLSALAALLPPLAEVLP
ncbi:MAG: dethiobiotin synthase [Dongiaceae bacterium]